MKPFYPCRGDLVLARVEQINDYPAQAPVVGKISWGRDRDKIMHIL